VALLQGETWSPVAAALPGTLGWLALDAIALGLCRRSFSRTVGPAGAGGGRECRVAVTLPLRRRGAVIRVSAEIGP